jgi:hypothetical protein
MGRWRSLKLGVVLAFAFSFSVLLIPAGARAQSRAADTAGAFFDGIRVIAPNDVWAVGALPDPNDPDELVTLAEHWDGRAFTIVPTPSLAEENNVLEAVAGVAADDVWAVGHANHPSFRDHQVLLEHWDGTKWKLFPANVPTKSILVDVAAVSPTDAWAVGSQSSGGNGLDKGLIEHWDGNQWSPVSIPKSGEFDGLAGVSARSARDVWAVGSSRVETEPNGDQVIDTLVLHFDGQTWKRVASFDTPSLANTLSEVVALGRSDVWAVGEHHEGIYDQLSPRTLVEHWNGSEWKQVASVDPGELDRLSAVDADAANDVWALGDYAKAIDRGAPIVERFDGSAWKLKRRSHAILRDVGVVSAHDVWGAGDDVEHWDGTGWTIVPT